VFVVATLASRLEAQSPIGAGTPLPAGYVAFDHTHHVPQEWLQSRGPGVEEFWRDCRGCHQYDRPEAERVPLHELCVRCHFHNPRRVLFRPQETPPLRSLFDHADHLKTDCKECHWADADGSTTRTKVRGVDVAPASFEVPKVDMAYCFGCHDPASQPAKLTPEQHASFIAGLNAKLAARHAGGSAPARFSHLDHLAEAALESKDPSKCVACHVDIAGADARNLHEKQFSVANCNESCHTAKFEVETYEKPSVTKATFLHRYHLRDRALEADPELARERCFRCHEFADRTESVPDHMTTKSFFKDAVNSGGKGPSSCTSCHYHESWGVEGHGQVAKCAGCHELADEFVDVAKLAGNRPLVDVKRPRVSGFVAAGQKHPIITTAGAAGDVSRSAAADRAIAEDCKSCHLTGLEELPSRVASRPFRHDSHLSANPKPEDCEVCHAGVKLSSTPADIKIHSLASGVALSYDPRACGTCHLGRELEPSLEGETRRVFEFSHLDHLKRNPPGLDRRASCLDCHSLPTGAEPRPGGEAADFVGDALPPRIANCTQCHNHGEFAEYTGNVRKADLDACQRCHTIGVPGKTREVKVERLRIARMSGPQVHETGRACRDCHQVPSGPKGVRPAVDSIFALTFGENERPSQHVAAALDQIPDAAWRSCRSCAPGGAKNHQGSWRFERETHCIDCHWFVVKRANALENEPYSSWTATRRRAQFGDVQEVEALLIGGAKHRFPGVPPLEAR
jgi:hypothetical protein